MKTTREEEVVSKAVKCDTRCYGKIEKPPGSWGEKQKNETSRSCALP